MSRKSAVLLCRKGEAFVRFIRRDYGCNLTSGLKVKREKRCYSTLRIWLPLGTVLDEHQLIYQGTSSDRFVLSTYAGGTTPVGLIVFDVERGAYKHLCALPTRDLNWRKSAVTAIACSGSGSTIAASVREENFRTICVVSVDLDTHSVSNIRCVACEEFDCMYERVLPCFIGVGASELVAVECIEGYVFRVGREDNRDMQFVHAGHQPVVGKLLEFDVCADGCAPSIESFTSYIAHVLNIPGSSTLLALVTHGHSWEVCEADLDGEGPMRKRTVIPRTDGEVASFSQVPGYGLYMYDHHGDICSLSTLYSMKLGVMRQCWMEACLCAGNAKA
jgi:hypothetical protein